MGWREEGDTLQHVLFRCQALMTQIDCYGRSAPAPDTEDMRSAEVVVALATAFRALQSQFRLRLEGWREKTTAATGFET